jgi:RNA polymerase sigma factor for flagellar operon FliA
MERERGEAQRFETTSIENMPEVIQNIAEDESQRPDMLMEQSQMHEALENAIAALPERDQLIVSLYYVDELNLREIGETIGVSEARVSQLLSAIAKTLRKSLQFKLKIFGRY